MKRKVFIVPQDRMLRKELSDALIVITSIRLKNGKVIDVVDYNAYAPRLSEVKALRRCEIAEIEEVEEGEA